MHRALLSFAQALLIEPRCPICDGPWDSPLPPSAPCTTCLDALALPGQGLKGLLPLLWCALGPYAGPLRQLLLKLRQPRQGKALAALVQLLSERFTLPATAVLVLIPSWKRQRSKPLPQRIALGLGRSTVDLLRRSRAGVSQHHLNKRERHQPDRGVPGLPHGQTRSPQLGLARGRHTHDRFHRVGCPSGP